MLLLSSGIDEYVAGVQSSCGICDIDKEIVMSKFEVWDEECKSTERSEPGDGVG